ncbi:hypothetical protein ACFYXJ_04970 [Streptomyces sp. NPDC002667]|uniref:hypothetical protein n=1 Tax=Streptomyces sp. NPDC002667 TaxID=3364657 RepID=UPI00367B6852
MATQTSSEPSSTFYPAFVRVAVAAQTLTLFFQAATAGLLLSHHLGVLHAVGARVMYGAAMLYVLAAIVAWRPGGGSPKPILYGTTFLVLASGQVVLGITHTLSLHVPLGVLMFAMSFYQLGRELDAMGPVLRHDRGGR